MHCFACDRALENPALDKPTGRYYCDRCLSSTVEEQLRHQGKDYTPYFNYEEESAEFTVPVDRKDFEYD